MKIKQRLVPVKNRKAIYKGKNTNTTLTVHQTGNTASGANAEMHARLQEGGYPRSSWHVQSDDKEIIQSYPDSAQCWHAGDGQGLGNMHSFSWEICINHDGDYMKALQIASVGIADKLKDLKLTPKDLRQHYNWSRKNCPAQIRAGKGGVNWTQFVAMVQKAFDGKTVAKPKAPKKDGYSFDEVVSRTIAGKYGSQPQRENNINTQTQFSYDEIQAGVNRRLRGNTISFDQVVTNTIDGVYKNGEERSRRIRALGYNPSAVQAEVNKRLIGRVPKKTANTIAREVIRGEWGNGVARKNKLKAAGYNPLTIQREVNRIL